MAPKVPRLKSDPAMGVGACCAILEQWMEARQSRDLVKLLAPLESIGWKMAPRASVIVEFSDLYCMFMAKTDAPRLRHAVLKDASSKCHLSEAGACLFGHSTQSIDDLASKVSVRCRKVFGQIRDALASADPWQLILDKASVGTQSCKGNFG